MIMKKTLSLLLAVIIIGMTFTALPITANAVDVDAAGTAVDKTFTINNAEDLSAAVSEINAATTETSYVIDLRTDLNDCGIDIQNEAKVKVTVTIIGNGHTLSTTTHTLVCADNGATVNIGDGESALTIQGDDLLHPEIGNDDLGLVYVLSDSTCNMRDKVTLKDRRGDNCLGGGVSVQGGTFIMDGGTIENCGVDGGSVCYGGGVAVYAGGTFTMNGGTISDCYATSEYTEEIEIYENCYTGMGGGVFVSDGSAFTMNGGTITNNTATNFGGGVAMTLADTEVKIDPDTGEEVIDSKTGKAVVDLGNPKSRAAINSGTISGNKAKNGAGVFASGLIYAYAHTIATDPLDTGDQFEPGLYINGGADKAVEISSNNATDMGGGVLAIGLRATRKAQIFNAQINNNTAAKGAGVMNYSYWTQLDIDGCTISDNKSTLNGGGIAAIQNINDGIGTFGYTAIKNTTITGNTSGARGAGVYYDSDSEIKISGKDVIQDNTFDGKQNNLNILSLEKPVTVIGDLTGSQIGLSDPALWDDGLEDYNADAVSTKRLTDGFKANNASLIPADAFTSDHESWVVDFGEKKTEQGAEIGRTYNYKAVKYNNVKNVEDGCRIVKEGSKQFICLKAETFTDGTTNDLNTIYSDMLTRYQRKYDNENKGYTYYGDPYFYDPASGKYVTLYQWGTIVYIFIGDYEAVYNEIDQNCDCLLYAGVSHQQYAQSGEIVYQYQAVSPDSSLFVSPTFELIDTQTDLSFNTALDFNGNDTIDVYKRNDLGIITTKYVIDKSSEVVDIQYDTVTTDYTNEVRLVRKTKIDYHINNADIAAAKYNNNDIFTSYVETATGKEIAFGDTINKFYTIPEVVPTDTNSCPYIFKGWYYDKENDNDSHPVQFGTDVYTARRDIYAHWIKVENVRKHWSDENVLPPRVKTYGGFDLAGVQIRRSMLDTNFGKITPGGMRFITSLSMDVVKKINALQPDNPNNIEYGYVATTNTDWITYHDGYEKLQYVSKTANGIDTSETAENENYFGFAENIDCTSAVAKGRTTVVPLDHQNYDGYLLYSLVINYDEENPKGYDTKVLARPYIHYTDANGSDRVAYSEYLGKNANKIGGCYISYNDIVAPSGN